MNSFYLNNYHVIDNFITKEKAEHLYKLFTEDIQNNPEQFQLDNQCPSSPAIYNYLPFLELLCEKTIDVKNIICEPVLPTYCYARLYKHGEVLHPHTDRPSCETSLTLHLGGDKDWEFWITRPDGTDVSIVLNPGQAILYKGIIARHWREEFKGSKYAQVFLHYVRSNGEHWEHFFDRLLNV